MPYITILGAGSTVFARQLMTDILQIEGLDEGCFALVDIDSARLELACQVAERLIAQSGKSWTVRASTERRDLLSVDGRLFRQPLIEPIPAYRSSNQTFQAIAQARLAGSWSNTEIADLAENVARCEPRLASVSCSDARVRVSSNTARTSPLRTRSPS